MRRVTRPFWMVLALLFLIEAWLWDRSQPVIAWIVARLPLRALKAWIALQIERLPPWATLIVFVTPAIILLPVKFGSLWLFAHAYWLSAIAVLIAAKLVGVAMAAFIFDATRPKLLQMVWFRRLYGTVLAWRDWAHALVDPYKQEIRQWVQTLKSREGALWLRQAQRLRARAFQREARARATARDGDGRS